MKDPLHANCLSVACSDAIVTARPPSPGNSTLSLLSLGTKSERRHEMEPLCQISGEEEPVRSESSAPPGSRVPRWRGVIVVVDMPRRPHLDVREHLGVGARHERSSPRHIRAACGPARWSALTDPSTRARAGGRFAARQATFELDDTPVRREEARAPEGEGSPRRTGVTAASTATHSPPVTNPLNGRNRIVEGARRQALLRARARPCATLRRWTRVRRRCWPGRGSAPAP